MATVKHGDDGDDNGYDDDHDDGDHDHDDDNDDDHDDNGAFPYLLKRYLTFSLQGLGPLINLSFGIINQSNLRQ